MQGLKQIMMFGQIYNACIYCHFFTSISNYLKLQNETLIFVLVNNSLWEGILQKVSWYVERNSSDYQSWK